MLEEQVEQLSRRLQRVMAGRLDHGRHRLDAAVRHEFFRCPERLVARRRERLGLLQRNLRASLPRRLSEAGRRLEAAAKTLDAVSPRSVLARGYSYTLGPDSRVLRRVGDVAAGQSLTTVLADGNIKSVVEGEAATRPPPADRPRPRSRRSAKRSAPPAGPTLFG